jgi:hypothetical protein
MLKITGNEKIKQVYTAEKAEMIKFLSWWANLKGVDYLGDYFVKDIVKDGVTVYYADFFGVYFEYVTQEIIDDFYRNRKGALIAKIEKDVETIKGAHK